ncbi:MAG: hypothetical protein QF689_04265 [Candidatus Latescibacteria bacterium]|nr:hypothetical protein [Candidatus Latescibacterota bacterium]MDP7447782.1 hypothetical protein [Candidatus Latescibacterota bacterium]HJP31451.1 hypothetical protein [Candidatus Latescibacterota bacterium]
MRSRVWAALLMPAILLMGCIGGTLQGFLPPVYEYTSLLVPNADGDAAYAVNADGSITFDEEGLRITVRNLSDNELNERYSDVSYQDRFSANPFTYGNWRDPSLGYTPSRFTVFEVEVFNPVLPKVELPPNGVVLRTGQGEYLQFFGINREDSENSLEDYYTLTRGPGGNEQYRFDQRMGIIREELYRGDQQVFKGDDYSGFIVFESLHPDVTTIELLVTDLALQFDESNNPSKTTDLTFRFDRRIDKRRLEGEEERAARQRTWVLPATAQR